MENSRMQQVVSTVRVSRLRILASLKLEAEKQKDLETNDFFDIRTKIKIKQTIGSENISQRVKTEMDYSPARRFLFTAQRLSPEKSNPSRKKVGHRKTKSDLVRKSVKFGVFKERTNECPEQEKGQIVCHVKQIKRKFSNFGDLKPARLTNLKIDLKSPIQSLMDLVELANKENASNSKEFLQPSIEEISFNEDFY